MKQDDIKTGYFLAEVEIAGVKLTHFGPRPESGVYNGHEGETIIVNGESVTVAEFCTLVNELLMADYL